MYIRSDTMKPQKIKLEGSPEPVRVKGKMPSINFPPRPEPANLLKSSKLSLLTVQAVLV